MTEAPMRIWAWIYADPWGNELRWFEWENHTPEADEAEYILATEHDRIVAEKDAELAAARDKALEDAARMVDCACECREAVLTANTRVERWNACGRDPCGALDAADIRALKESPDA